MGLELAMTDERCDGCKFFAPTDAIDKRYRGGKDEDIKLGVCRRMPPVPEHGGEQASMWPKTMASFWCGEFKAKDAEK